MSILERYGYGGCSAKKTSSKLIELNGATFLYKVKPFSF